MDDFNSFAESIMRLRYSWGGKETWEEIAHRVSTNVMGAVAAPPDLVEDIEHAIAERKFIPGGRFLAQAGRGFHQVNNCLSGDTEIVTDRGIFRLDTLVGQRINVRNRFGTYEPAVVSHFGKQELWKITLENDQVVYATGNHRWWMPDNSRVTTTELEFIPFSVPGNVDMDEEGVRHGIIYGDGTLCNNGGFSRIDFCTEEKATLSQFFDEKVVCVTAGFGAKNYYSTHRVKSSGKTTVALQPAQYKTLPDLSCSPEYARGFIAGLFATDGSFVPSAAVPTLSVEGLDRARYIAKLATLGGVVVGRVSVSSVVNPYTGEKRELCVLFLKAYSVPFIREDQAANFNGNFKKYKNWVGVESVVPTGVVADVYCAVVPGTESFTLANGLSTSNCFMLRAEDTREGWGDLLNKATTALMSGGGVGVDYSALRKSGAGLKRSGGTSSGPIPLMKVVNEVGRGVMAGGQRRSAIWAGLRWSHPDVMKFIVVKNWIKEVRKLKEADVDFPAPMDMTNVSVILDSDFFAAFDDQSNPMHATAQEVYWAVVERMTKTGEPGFSVDYKNKNESLRNPCCEVVSEDDSDVCCLGSINLERISSVIELAHVTELAQAFLLAGTVYSHVPYEKVAKVREKNRRTGLGLLGVHAWMIQRGIPYGPSDEMAQWLATWKSISDSSARFYAGQWSLNTPMAKRAIAPTGTTSIAGGLTTSGIEPIFSVAFRRRYLTPDGWKSQLVVDFVADRLVEQGADPDTIEDAYKLSLDVERRIAFQAFVQEYVDNAISSTINMPALGKPGNSDNQKFGETLYRYLPQLRGITVYPDSARANQPLTPVDFTYARKHKGVVFEATESPEL